MSTLSAREAYRRTGRSKSMSPTKSPRLSLGKTYAVANLFRDCKTGGIGEDVNKAVWFALSNYIFENLTKAQPEGVIVPGFGTFSKFKTGIPLWQPAAEFEKDLSVVGTSNAPQIFANELSNREYANIATDAQVTQNIVVSAIKRMAQQLAVQARKGLTLSITMAKLGVLWSRGRTCGFRFDNKVEGRSESVGLPSITDAYSHTAAASSASLQQSQQAAYSHTATAHAHSSLQQSQSLKVMTKQSKKSIQRYASKQTMATHVEAKRKVLEKQSKHEKQLAGYTHTHAVHAHSNLKQSQEQSHGELLGMVGELKEKLEGKYQEEMEREIQSRMKIYIKELTVQHEERVVAQMARMKKQYEERMAQITLVHEQLLVAARKETVTVKTKLAEFSTNNHQGEIANLKSQVVKLEKLIASLKIEISTLEEEHSLEARKLQKRIEKAHAECPRCASTTYELAEAVRVKEEAEHRVETFIQEKSTKMQAKLTNLNDQISSSALDYEKEIAILKEEARKRFASLKTQLETAERMRKEYSVQVSALKAKSSRTEMELSKSSFQVKTLHAEVASLREQLRKPCAKCSTYQEEVRVEKLQHQLAVSKVSSEREQFKMVKRDMEAKWALMHKKHIEQQHEDHEERVRKLKEELMSH